jgi:isoleucyl-tRNA synthetase
MGSFKDTLLLPKTDMPIAANLPASEPAVYAKWQNEDVYGRMTRHGSGDAFVLHDGPPYANGDIHIGHALNKILKDFVVKLQYFSGRGVRFQPGWDCHGLPIEQAVYAKIRLGGGNMPCFKDPKVVKSMCRKYAEEQIEKQKAQFKTLGVLADWDNHYDTMAPYFEVMISNRLKELQNKGLLNRRLKPVYWSWAYQTALAEAEVEYRERTDNSIYLAFPTAEPTFPGGFLVWTTTPWTLPANVAVALHPDLEYAAYKVKGFQWPLVMLKSVATGKLVHLVEEQRGPVFPGKAFTDFKLAHPIYPDQVVPVVMADFVKSDTGTGCVHIAPAHGEDDFRVAQAQNLPVVMPVGPSGRYTEGKYGPTEQNPDGQWIFEDDSNTSLAAKRDGTYKENSYNSNPNILADLRERGLLLHTEKITHNYPYCSRSGTPVIFRATEQWFLDLDKIRKQVLEFVEWGGLLHDAPIEFFPDNSKNRMLPMLKERPDWCISRQRVWGVPIFDGPDILDVWFDSGLTWNTLQGGVADVYLEGNDQHRGWFQSSLWLSVALQGKAPYKKVITHGFVVDQEGKKMAKSKGNVVSPLDVTEKFGAEVLRYWVASIDYTKDVQCSQEIIKRAAEGYKKLRNTFRFLVANMPAEQPKDAGEYSYSYIDYWLLEKSHEVFTEVHKLFEQHCFFSGLHKLTDYINNDLSGIYMNAVKDTLYCDKPGNFYRDSAIRAMSKVLKALVGLLAPLFTYTAQEVFSYCPKWLFGEAKDVFDLVYEPLPKPVRLDVIEYLKEDFWKAALEAFHVEFDKAKTAGQVRDTLEVVIESGDGRAGFFAGAENWFVVSDCLGLKTDQEALGEFKVWDKTFRIVKSHKNKCERCWKRNAEKNLCQRCEKIVTPQV